MLVYFYSFTNEQFWDTFSLTRFFPWHFPDC